MSCKIYSTLLLIITLLNVSSCSKRVGDAFPNRASGTFDKSLANTSPDFIKGWRDGCEVGMSSASNSFYKMFHKSNEADGYKMAGSSDYRTAWSNAYWWCYRHDFVKQQHSIWGLVFSGYK